MLKKTLAVLTSLLLAAGLSFVAVAAPASATSYPPSGAAGNNPDNWEVATGEVCYKIEPVTTVPYPLPAPPANSAWSKIVVKAGSGDAANTIYTTGSGSAANTVYVDELVQGTLVQHATKDSISHLILCSTPLQDTVDCSAATVYLGAALTNGNYINMEVRQNGQTYTTAAYIDFWRAQWGIPETESGLALRITKIDGSQIYLPISNAQKNSGVLSFNYSEYLSGSWDVTWVQFDGHNWHFGADGETITCGTDEASAALTFTDATCDTRQGVALGAISNATWGELVVSDAGVYSVTATAIGTAKFSNGLSTLTFNGTLSPPDPTKCEPELKCLPKTAVSYTYTPGTNSGVITVVNPDPAVYSDELCDGFWVTATSWKYTTSNVWPQVRDVVQKLPKITTVGTYPYEAAVTCGQGDIYASYTAQPDPTENLYGPSNPFNETFLHGMGFTGPNPTWVQQTPGCNTINLIEPTATAITECGTYGSVQVPADTEFIDYTLTGNGQTGVNTVTAVARAPYVLKDYPTGGWTFDLGEYYDCAVELTISYVQDCPVDPTNTWRVYNPTEDTVVVTYGVDSTHSATPGYSTFTTPRAAETMTIAWGAAGSGTAVGTASATAGTDLDVNDPECIKLAEPVEPAITTVTECGVYGTVVAATTTGVDYDVVFTKETGDYTVTATPQDGYFFADDKTEVVYTGNVGAYYECVIDTDAVIVVGECTWNEDGTANFREVAMTFDNTKSNIDVPFEVVGFPEHNKIVPAGEKVTFSVANIWPAGGGYTVIAGTETFELTIEPCNEPVKPEPETREEVLSAYDCTTALVDVTTTTYTTDWVFNTETGQWEKGEEVAGTPVVTQRAMTPEEISQETCLVTVTDPAASTCEATDATELTSWIRVELNANVQYTIDGVVVTEEYTAVTPGAHTVVATALNGYTLQGAKPAPDDWTDTTHTWTFTAIDSADCEPPTLATVLPEYDSTPLTCDAQGSYTIGAEFGDVTWTVNGVETEAGTYPVTKPGTVTLEATPTNPEDTFEEGWVDEPIVLNFAFPNGTCENPALLAMTGAAASFAPIWVGALLTLTGLGLFLVRRKSTAQ